MFSKANSDRLLSFHHEVVKAHIQLSYAHLNNEKAVAEWERKLAIAQARFTSFVKANTADVRPPRPPRSERPRPKADRKMPIPY